MDNAEQDDHRPDLGRLAPLWMRTQSVVAAFIRGMVGDPNDVDDLVQLVAETCSRKFGQFDDRGDAQAFRKWALSIARFEVLRHYQQRQKSARCFSTEVIEMVASEFERSEVSQDERLEALRICVSRVTDRSRQLVEMKYFRELSTERIADRLGLSTSGVRVALFRTRQFLAECIQEQLKGLQA